MKKRILIIGSNGFIGRSLTTYLKKYYFIYKMSRKILKENSKNIRCDISNKKSFNQKILIISIKSFGIGKVVSPASISDTRSSDLHSTVEKSTVARLAEGSEGSQMQLTSATEVNAPTLSAKHRLTTRTASRCLRGVSLRTLLAGMGMCSF